jgi:hypothetical protein
MKSLGAKAQGLLRERMQASPRWDGLTALAPGRGARLLVPRLGEPVEPAQVDEVVPWWRGVDAGGAATVEAPLPETLPKSMPWPVD